MRIPFDITKRPQIESGEYKVVYVENSSMEQYPVEILKWDSNSDAGLDVNGMVDAFFRRYLPESKEMTTFAPSRNS